MVLNVSQREFNTNSVVFVSFFLVDLSFLTSFNHWKKIQFDFCLLII